MSSATKFMAGLTLFLVPIIQYGGYFLLTLLFDKRSGYMVNALRQNLFRAGHAPCRGHHYLVARVSNSCGRNQPPEIFSVDG